MSAADASPDNIDIRTLGRGLSKSVRTILLSSVLAAGAAYLVCAAIAPRYVSEAQLTLAAKASGNPFADPKGDGAAPDAVTVRMDKEALNTHVSALKAPDLATRIASEMQLDQKVEFNSALGNPDAFSAVLRLVGLYGPKPGESVKDRVLSNFLRQLEVFSVKESRVIHVRFTSNDPQLAAAVANGLAETYRKMVAEQRGTGSDTSELLAQLGPKVDQLTKDVADAEAEVERFRGQANIFTGAQKTTLNEQQLGELTAELSRMKAQRSEAEAKARSARELAQAGSADALPDVSRSPVMQTILQQRVRLERQISELSATLLPEHPRMRQLNADLANLKSQIKSEVTKIVDGFDKEAKLAAAREASIQKSIDEVKSRVVSGSTDEVKLRQLEATAKSKRVELERLQAQYEAGRVRTAAATAPVEVQILSAAHAASLPEFPKKGSYATLAFVAMLLLSTSLSIIKAAFNAARPGPNPKRRKSDRTATDDRASAPNPAERRAAPAVASEPDIVLPEPAMAKATAPAPQAAAAAPKAGAPAKKMAAPAKPQAALPPVAAALATIAGRIAERSSQQGGVRTLVVGDHELIDPAAEGIGIARSLAEKGAAAIVIDWSPTGDGIAEGLGLPAVPGMNELMTGAASFEDVVQAVPGTEVHLIACGEALPHDHGETDADLLNLLLDALDEAYDHIVVVGRFEAARGLFETILGRFDAGVLICEGKPRASEPSDTFLGFEVADIVLMRHERPLDPQAMAVQRALRATRGLPPGVERIRA